jgi:uncharacterized protein YcbK (DUF882 family)
MNASFGSIRRRFAVLTVVFALLAIALPHADASTRYIDRGKAGLSGRLVGLLHRIEANFGRKVIVVSGCRSRAHNRRIGGARESYHLRCMAADIFVPGVSKYRLWRALVNLPGRGGVGTYCRSAFVHIDVGPKREWAWGCGRKYKRRLARRK